MQATKPFDYLLREHLAVNYQNPFNRIIAKGMKNKNMFALMYAAKKMCTMPKRIPNGSILIPMPGREGDIKTAHTSLLCVFIQQRIDVNIIPALYGFARPSLYALKKEGIDPATVPVKMYTRLSYYQEVVHAKAAGKQIYIVDNVIDSGTTMKAALAEIPWAKPLVFAVDTKIRNHVKQYQT